MRGRDRMSGLPFLRRSNIRWFLVIALITCLAMTIIYTLSNDDGVGSNGGDPESKTIDYRGLYDQEGLGQNMQWSVDVPINGSSYVEVPDVPSMFTIYEVQPIDLEDLDSIEAFVGTHNLSIVNHAPVLIGPPFTTLYEVPPVRFQNETENIVVYAHGNINVRFNLTELPSGSTKINESQAYEIAERFLRDHAGIPDDVYEVLTGSSKDTYHFRYIRKVDGYPIYHSADMNQILIKVDRTKAAVLSYSHHWPSLSKVEAIPEEDLGDPSTLVEDFIEEHNKHLSSNMTSRINSVEYYYSATIGYSPLNNANESPFFLYLPYLKICWDTGTTFISPLSHLGT